MKVLILAGGGGTRLWPLSTEETPKQFSYLPQLKASLFQLTLQRALNITEHHEIFVITNQKYESLVKNQAQEIGLDLGENQLFLEPSRKNTLPAIIAGVYFAKPLQNEHILVLPSDHIFGDDLEFSKQVKELSTIDSLPITLFGVKPTSPHTGYGYIEAAATKDRYKQVISFKEKPDHKTAISFVDKGYYWNAGIFMFSLDSLKQELAQQDPIMYELFENNSPHDAFVMTTTQTSIDYGLLENANHLNIVELNSTWIDLGSWDAFVEHFKQEDIRYSSIDSNNNSVVDFTSKEITIIGVDDLIVVNHPNGLLISKKGQSQKVSQRKK
jgi:mannose-1-phosphate guanylyltransferase / mannose-6-phosphate isomerase